MNATINISLPKNMLYDAKKAVKNMRYSSVSELIRDALRKTLYPEITENGFTSEFEDRVLQADKEPDMDDVWKTEKDVNRFFKSIHQELEQTRHDKNQA